MKIVAQNKKAYHDYQILDTLEAGIVLSGDEVKSIRAGHASMVGSFANVHGGELFIVNMHITAYERAYNKNNKNDEYARRSRKLLLHKKQLHKLIGDISIKGITLVPLKMYINDKAKIKVEIGIAKHKKAPDKKQALKERDIKRETSREMKNYRS